MTPRLEGIFHLPSGDDDIARGRYILDGELSGLNVEIGIRTDGTVGLLQVAHRTDHPSPPALTARLMRRLPLETIRQRAVDDLARKARQVTELEVDPESRGAEVVRATLRAAKSTDWDTIRMAHAYDELVEGGERSPVPALAEQFHTSTSNVYRLLARARDQGWLYPAPRGRVGTGLTPDGQRMADLLLREH